MKAFSLFFVLMLLVAACRDKAPGPVAQIAEPEAEWIQLFNGRDLTGWTPKFRGHALGANYRNTFRVEDGVLKVSYEEYTTFQEEFGHLFFQTPYSHYRLRAEYRFVGEQVPDGPDWAFRNNGFMLHCQPAASMGLEQDFPISLEAQLLGGRAEGERPTMNLCTPGSNVEIAGELRTEHCMNSASQTYRGDQWVRVEMVVLGDSVIHHLVEGDTVLTYFNPRMGGGAISGYNPQVYVEGQPMGHGYIAIQAESHPTEFRKIELLVLEE